MSIALIYPLPFNLWDSYKDYVERFVRTFKEFPPDHDYVLYLTCHWGEPTDRIREMFYGTKAVFYPYNADGCQIGAQQEAVRWSSEVFIVGFTVHNYFHRAGWLNRLCEARQKHGPGIYGCSASYEGKPHIRTAGYAMDREYWDTFPHTISSRDDCSKFENGDWCISSFVHELGGVTMQVTWDGEQRFEESRKVEGVFRRGQQNAMLVWDRHTDLYRDSDPDQKKLLEDLADGVV